MRSLVSYAAFAASVTDSLTEILRSGARASLTQAVEAEVAEFLAKQGSATSAGCAEIVGIRFRSGLPCRRELDSNIRFRVLQTLRKLAG